MTRPPLRSPWISREVHLCMLFPSQLPRFSGKSCIPCIKSKLEAKAPRKDETKLTGSLFLSWHRLHSVVLSLIHSFDKCLASLCARHQMSRSRYSLAYSDVALKKWRDRCLFSGEFWQSQRRPHERAAWSFLSSLTENILNKGHSSLSYTRTSPGERCSW